MANSWIMVDPSRFVDWDDGSIEVCGWLTLG